MKLDSDFASQKKAGEDDSEQGVCLFISQKEKGICCSS